MAIAETFPGAPETPPVPSLGELKPSVAVKLVYSVGQTVESGYLVISGFIFFYYTAVLGLSGSAVGVALGLSMVLDSVLDPLIGSISDNIRSRYGRRLPMMIVGVPLTALAIWALLNPPIGISGMALFAWLFLTKASFRGFASLYNLPYAALGAEMPRYVVTSNGSAPGSQRTWK